jgi:glycosyltransferase involved in cell wall biosynthesis
MPASERPRAGFDALFLEQPMVGAGQYALNLWRELRDHQQSVEPHLLIPDDAPGIARAEARRGGFTRAVAPVPVRRLGGYARKLWWEQTGLPLASRRARVDLVHIPYFSAPLIQTVPYVVTVHDVIPLVLPSYGGGAKMREYMRLVTRTTRQARMVLTDSEHSRGDIIRLLGIPEDRIRVTPLAVSDLYQPVVSEDDRAAVSAVREKFGLEQPFVLNVGGFDLRKRLPHLLRGFAAALVALPASYDLVIAGNPHTGNAALYPPLEPLIRELGLERRVHLVGFVSDEDKRDLYRAARVFTFVSEYEGFGLTPLEAMACGAPVICSNRSSLPEVVGSAGVLIDPEPEDIARALVRVLPDDDLRSALSRQSVERAARFTWRRTMRLTLDAYQEALR